MNFLDLVSQLRVSEESYKWILLRFVIISTRCQIHHLASPLYRSKFSDVTIDEASLFARSAKI
jgi:hypothetical protein